MKPIFRSFQVAALLFTTTACASSESTRPEPLMIFGNLKTIEIAPVLVAAEHIQRPPVPVGAGGIPNLVGEARSTGSALPRADLGTHAETQALRYSVRHPDLRIILTVAEGHYRIVARRSAGINALADLKGKRVATSAPTSAGYFLHKMLTHAGLTGDDITLVPLRDLATAPALMNRREADAVAIWEPYSDNVRQVLGEDAIEFSGEGIYRESFNLNTTASKLSDPVKRRQIVDFVRSIIRASRIIEADPAAGKALVSNAGEFTADEVERAWRHHSFPVSLAPNLIDTLVEEEVWLARAEKRVPRSREQLEQLIDHSVLAEALSAHE